MHPILIRVLQSAAFYIIPKLVDEVVKEMANIERTRRYRSKQEFHGSNLLLERLLKLPQVQRLREKADFG